MHIHAYSTKNRVFSQKYVSLASNPGRHPFFCPKICCFYFRFLEIFTPAVIPTTAAATTTMTNTATGAEPFFVVPFPLTIFPVSSAPVSELAFAGPLTLSSGSILIAATSFPLSARSPPFYAFSSAESVPAALLPSVPGCAESPVAPP